MDTKNIDVHAICGKWALRLSQAGLRFDVARTAADYGEPLADGAEYDADMDLLRRFAAAEPEANLEECASMARADYGVD